MSRPLRIEYPGAWYHVMNKGRSSEKVYLNKNDAELLSRINELEKRIINSQPET